MAHISYYMERDRTTNICLVNCIPLGMDRDRPIFNNVPVKSTLAPFLFVHRDIITISHLYSTFQPPSSASSARTVLVAEAVGQ